MAVKTTMMNITVLNNQQEKTPPKQIILKWFGLPLKIMMMRSQKNKSCPFQKNQWKTIYKIIYDK